MLDCKIDDVCKFKKSLIQQVKKHFNESTSFKETLLSTLYDISKNYYNQGKAHANDSKYYLTMAVYFAEQMHEKPKDYVQDLKVLMDVSDDTVTAFKNLQKKYPGQMKLLFLSMNRLTIYLNGKMPYQFLNPQPQSADSTLLMLESMGGDTSKPAVVHVPEIYVYDRLQEQVDSRVEVRNEPPPRYIDEADQGFNRFLKS